MSLSLLTLRPKAPLHLLRNLTFGGNHGVAAKDRILSAPMLVHTCHLPPTILSNPRNLAQRHVAFLAPKGCRVTD